jgi:D-galactose 1-dehydrogenase
MTTWHSQYNDGVDEAKRLLAGKRVSQLLVNWREDVRKWHPGQAWIFEAGGYGVFDPGINALSIVTKVMPEPLFVREAELIFPSNKDAPIAATMRFASGGGDEELRAEFDWRPIDREVWEITVGTDDGTILHLSKGGAKLDVNGQTVMDQRPEEYEAIYRHFADLLHGGRSHVDPAPMRLVTDAFMLGRRAETEPFSDS